MSAHQIKQNFTTFNYIILKEKRMSIKLYLQFLTYKIIVFNVESIVLYNCIQDKDCKDSFVNFSHCKFFTSYTHYKKAI